MERYRNQNFYSEGINTELGDLLHEGEVHVWRANLGAPGGTEDWLWQLLSQEERTRAQRFRFEQDRKRFVVARGRLRQVLGDYLSCGGSELQFGYSEHGKPYLSGVPLPLRFNLSHSGEMVLLAVSLGHEIGVDVEQVRQDVEVAKLAKRFFSPYERARVLSLEGDEKVAAFFRVWAGKEAYVKARGAGLTLALDSFDVSVEAGEAAALVATRPDRGDAERWKLWSLEAGPGYAAAMAVEGRTKPPQVFDWEAEGRLSRT